MKSSDLSELTPRIETRGRKKLGDGLVKRSRTIAIRDGDYEELAEVSKRFEIPVGDMIVKMLEDWK